MLSPGEDPSPFDRAWMFLQGPSGCAAAIVCLVGGLICATGIGRSDWRFALFGAILMLPFALPAALFLIQFVGALLIFAPLAIWAWSIEPFLQKMKRGRREL